MSDQRQPRTPRVPRTALLTGAFIATLGLGFLGGAYHQQLYSAVAPLIGIKTSTDTLDLSSVQSTFQTLKANFDGKIDDSALIDGAKKGMVEAAGDRYTEYMTKAEAEAFNNDLTGNIGGGIGVELSERNNRVTVTRVLADSPAGKAGVLAGDVIGAINDESNGKWTVDDIVSRVRGEVGTTVKLGVIRNNEPKEFTITRRAITDPSVRSEVRDGVGILTISRFDEQTGTLARIAARSFKEQNVNKVILDLRGNGGGYLKAAQDVSSIWLDKKMVVSERKDGRTVDELMSGSNPILNGIPTIVLVNGASASASEIVAGALADNGAATLLGEKTFGKGSVQQLVDLPDGAQLKVTVARWFTPKGNNISEKGITPSVVIERSSDDVNNNRDPQLDAALQRLNS